MSRPIEDRLVAGDPDPLHVEPDAEVRSATPTEVAWAAGFWDGEGTAVARPPGPGHPRQVWACVTQASFDEHCPEVLDRFAAAVGFGRLLGPYAPPGNRRPLYKWKTNGADDVARLLAVLRPYLGAVKQEQLRRALALHAATPTPSDSEAKKRGWITRRLRAVR